MRRKAMCLLGLTLAIGLLGVASAMAAGVSSPTSDATGAPAAPLASCGSAVCVWEQANFSGGEGTVDCSAGAHGASGRSAINGCGSAARLFSGGSEIACMNPGGERPNPGAFDSVHVGGSC